MLIMILLCTLFVNSRYDYIRGFEIDVLLLVICVIEVLGVVNVLLELSI